MRVSGPSYRVTEALPLLTADPPPKPRPSVRGQEHAACRQSDVGRTLHFYPKMDSTAESRRWVKAAGKPSDELPRKDETQSPTGHA